MTTKFLLGTFMTTKFLVFISSFYFFCCVPILCWKSWSFLLVVEHQCHVPPISPFYQRNLYFGMLGHSVELFLGQIFSLFVWRENGVGTYFEQQFFSFTQHQVPSISTVKIFLIFYSTTT